ncbi:DUF559 domain-containing protein [Candidatus Peregrinibacteria bacterium]|nr:DUF559 domain-containing protein [Candidatus Peregrinibacteria bacterium]MBI3815991.1 DUF559 domain-containing protein [Candidatus Peregrinibacteria bacterium]
MFTGLIEATAKVLSKDDHSIVLERPRFFDDLKIGSSIAVSGVCLSVIAFHRRSMTFDIIPETWSRTKLGMLRNGESVNLERAMRAADRFEGHIVQGHVEGIGTVTSIPLPLPPREEGERTHKRAMNRNILHFSREMRKKPTRAEEALWQALRYERLGVRFRRQYPLGGRILDFYCPSLNIAIEVDGSIHRSDAARKEDDLRYRSLQEYLGVRTLRFTNEDVLRHLETVLTVIHSTIRTFPPPPPEEGSGVEGNLGIEFPTRIPPGREGTGERVEDVNSLLTISLPNNLLPFVVPKGSIAIDGVSLTVTQVEDGRCTVALIPHTREKTTLGSLAIGDFVNVETDFLVRSVRKEMP